MENNLGNLRSSLFDMGCIREEKIANCGRMFANVRIGNDELDQFLAIKDWQEQLENAQLKSRGLK